MNNGLKEDKGAFGFHNTCIYKKINKVDFNVTMGFSQVCNVKLVDSNKFLLSYKV